MGALYIPSKGIHFPSRELLPFLSPREWEQGTRPWHKDCFAPEWRPGSPWFPGRERAKRLLAVGVCFPTFGSGAVHREVTAGSVPLAIPTPTSYWSMDEAAGTTRVDSAGTNSLADQGTTPSTTGILGNAAGTAFSGANFLKKTAWSGSGLTIATVHGYEFALWFKPNNLTSFQDIIYSSQEILRLNSSGQLESIGPTWGGTLSVGTWYFVRCGHRINDSNGTDFLTVNNGAKVLDTAHTYTLASFLSIGSGAFATNGLIDEVAYWQDLNLTDVQAATLYNSGAGRTYSGGGWH